MNNYFKFNIRRAEVLIMALLVWICGYAQTEFEIDGIYYRIGGISPNGHLIDAAVISHPYNGYSGDIKIPNKIEYDGITYDVTCIENFAFWDSDINSIFIPYNVDMIGDWAFRDCSLLTSVTCASKNLYYIGEDIFEGISNEATLYYSEDLCYGALKSWFTNKEKVNICGDNLSWYTIPITSETLRLVIDGYGEMYDYSENENPFLHLKDEITEIFVGTSTTSIGRLAFCGLSNVFYAFLPNSLKKIATNPFAGCNLTYIRTDWDDNSPYINTEHGIVERSTNSLIIGFKDGIMPEGIDEIGIGAFALYSNLDDVIVPEGVKYIDDHAFIRSSINSITLPSTLNEMGAFFFDLSDLKYIVSNAKVPPSMKQGINAQLSKITVPYACAEAYKTAFGWKDFADIIVEAAPPSTTTLTIGSTGCTTFSSIYNLDFSNVDGIKAYTATGYNSDNCELILVRIKEAKAGTGLYVSGNAGTYTIPTILSTSYNSLNMFVGVNEETTISTTDGSYTNYIYTKPSGNEAGFYKVTNNRAIPAGKAYLQIPTAWLNEETASEAKAVKLVFDDGESTGIDEVNRVESKEDAIYDLQGRRVKNLSKGIYIINGRKVVR